MGNRGTTPSWDDEQIAKFGLFEHMRMVAAPFVARDRERRKVLVQEYIDECLATLGNSSEENRARLSTAIPDVVPTLILRIANGTLLPDWRQTIAGSVYRDFHKRTSPDAPTQDFGSIPEEDQRVFLEIVDAVAQVWEARNRPNP